MKNSTKHLLSMAVTIVILVVAGFIYASIQFPFHVSILKDQHEKQLLKEEAAAEQSKEPVAGPLGFYYSGDLEMEREPDTLIPTVDKTKHIFTTYMMGEVNPLIFSSTYLGEYVKLRLNEKGLDVNKSKLPDKYEWLSDYYEEMVDLKYPRMHNVDIVEPHISLILYNKDQIYNLKLNFRFLPVQKRRDDNGKIIYFAREMSMDELNRDFTFDPPLDESLWDHMDEINDNFILNAKLTIEDAVKKTVLSETYSYRDEIDPNQKDSLRGAVRAAISFMEARNIIKTWHNSGKLSDPNRRVR